MVQKDIKSLVAYSSVSHLGFVMLGMCALNTIGFSGSLLQQLNHGLSTGALFLLVGIIYERRHTRLIADYGGLFKVVPVYGVFFMITMLSSVGLPGTNGFVGEFLILLGAFRSQTVAAVFGTAGIVLAAGYMLWMFQRVFFGKVTNPENDRVTDMTLRERAVMAPLIVMIFVIGLYPKPFLERMEPALQRMLSRVEQVRIVREQALTPTLFVGPAAVPVTNEPEEDIRP
jgi:NADH-quinone oxidoreductase subunit M